MRGTWGTLIPCTSSVLKHDLISYGSNKDATGIKIKFESNIRKRDMVKTKEYARTY